MGLEHEARWLLVGVLVAITGCSPQPDPEQHGDAPLFQGAKEDSRFLDPHPDAPYAALPKFIDGGLRCQVDSPRNERPLPQSPGPRVWALDPGSSERIAPCSAPGPWCSVFGPTGSDIENAHLRDEVSRLQLRGDARIGQLEARVRRAEELAERERHLRLEQLRRISESAEHSIYLTNDESMSLASPQRLIWAIDNGEPLPAAEVRPHELLNYFSFRTLPVNPDEVFSVLPEVSQHPLRPSDLTLSLAVRGEDVKDDERRSLNLTYVVDRSGSMAGQGRMEFVKRGILRSLRELVPGDSVQVVLFDTTTCPLVQNFVVGRDPLNRLARLIALIEARGGSNLGDGLLQGYAIANQSYRPEASNRVVLLTDAEATSLTTSEEVIALSARQYDARRVRLSAVGVGVTVSDRLLDRLTEAGKGASVFLSSEAEVDAVFGTRFSSLVETVATNVHFRLDLPPALHLRAFYGEEASPKKERVQALHFFSGTEQMYLANLRKERALGQTDTIRLTIEFDDPETGEPRESSFSWRGDELEMATGEKSRFRARNLTKARMVATFGYQLRYMAEEFGAHERTGSEGVFSVSGNGVAPGSAPTRTGAVVHCRRVKGRLDAFAAELGGEPEATRIVNLWHRYCERFGTLEDDLLAQVELGPSHKLVQLEKDLFESVSHSRNEYPPERGDF